MPQMPKCVILDRSEPNNNGWQTCELNLTMMFAFSLAHRMRRSEDKSCCLYLPEYHLEGWSVSKVVCKQQTIVETEMYMAQNL